MTDDLNKFLARHEPHRSRRRGWSWEVWLLGAIWAFLFLLLFAAGVSLYWRVP